MPAGYEPEAEKGTSVVKSREGGGNLPALDHWGVAKPGKAADFGSVTEGSNPSAPAKHREYKLGRCKAIIAHLRYMLTPRFTS